MYWQCLLTLCTPSLNLTFYSKLFGLQYFDGLQCFDAVGWVTGRASGLYKLSGRVLVWLSVWSEVQTCPWPSWCHCHSMFLASVKSRLVLPFWYRLTWAVPDKGPLNVCVCVLNPAFYTDSDHVQQKSMQTLLQGLADNKVLYKSTTYLKSISSSSHLVSEVPAGYNDLLKANTRDLWSRFCTRQTSLLLFNEEHSIEEKITVSKQQLMILPRRCR